jgi:hypothetical protein
MAHNNERTIVLVVMERTADGRDDLHVSGVNVLPAVLSADGGGKGDLVRITI